MKRLEAVLRIIQQGPATSRDVAEDLFGKPTRDSIAKASSALSELREIGLVTVIGRIKGDRTINGKTVKSRPANIWSAT